jgi:hypothetical protein
LTWGDSCVNFFCDLHFGGPIQGVIMRCFQVIVAVLIFLLPTFAMAGDEGEVGYTNEQIEDLLVLKHSLLVVHELQELGVVDDVQVAAGEEHYLDRAQGVTGRPMTSLELMSVEGELGFSEDLTGLQQFAGLVTAVNTGWFLGIMLLVGGGSYIFRKLIGRLMDIFISIPMIVWEVVFYLASIAVIYLGLQEGVLMAPYIGLTGTLMFATAVRWSFTSERLGKRSPIYFWVITAVWTTAALLYGSDLLGFFAVEALMVALGFSIGFEGDVKVPRATLAAFGILVLFVIIEMGFLPRTDLLEIFKPGAFWSGSFVAGLGLLIMSTRWCTEKVVPYLFYCVATITFGVGAIFIGDIWQIDDLSKIGYWLLVLFALVKYCEIPVKSKLGYAFLSVGLGIIMFAAAYYFNTHHDVFITYFLF